MQINPYPRISLEQFSDADDYFIRAASNNLNPFLDQISIALSGNLNYQNLLVEDFDVAFLDSEEKSIKLSKIRRPKFINVGYSDGAMPYAIITKYEDDFLVRVKVKYLDGNTTRKNVKLRFSE